jgi:hypothetical protein
LVGDKLEFYHGFLVACELLPLKSLSATVLESAAARALFSFSMNTFSILFAWPLSLALNYNKLTFGVDLNSGLADPDLTGFLFLLLLSKSLFYPLLMVKQSFICLLWILCCSENGLVI